MICLWSPEIGGAGAGIPTQTFPAIVETSPTWKGSASHSRGGAVRQSFNPAMPWTLLQEQYLQPRNPGLSWPEYGPTRRHTATHAITSGFQCSGLPTGVYLPTCFQGERLRVTSQVKGFYNSLAQLLRWGRGHGTRLRAQAPVNPIGWEKEREGR